MIYDIHVDLVNRAWSTRRLRAGAPLRFDAPDSQAGARGGGTTAALRAVHHREVVPQPLRSGRAQLPTGGQQDFKGRLAALRAPGGAAHRWLRAHLGQRLRAAALEAALSGLTGA